MIGTNFQYMHLPRMLNVYCTGWLLIYIPFGCAIFLDRRGNQCEKGAKGSSLNSKDSKYMLVAF